MRLKEMILSLCLTILTRGRALGKSLPFEDSSNIIKNLYSTFSETLTAKGNHLEKKDIVEEESARWHNTTCSVVKEAEGHLHFMFNESDLNHDGILDKDEIYNEFFLKIAEMQAPWRFVLVPSDNRDHFVFMDFNQDGLVSYSEFFSVHRVIDYLSYSFINLEAKNFIQRYDSNEDSKVSIEEINSKEFYDNFFQRYDVNLDNFLDFNETLQGLKEKFDGLPIDKNRKVLRWPLDKKEMREHFEDMDHNHDELISMLEFNKMHLVYADMYNIFLYRDIDSIIEILDTIHDGQISYMELGNWTRIARYFCDLPSIS